MTRLPYLDPPPNTLVLCFDQKGPVPFRQRRGTGYLLAALDPHSGRVWGRCFRRYNSFAVIWFFGWLLRQLPQDQQIVIIWDNASPHSKKVKQWLHKRYGRPIQWLHTPTKAAWLNLIEAWMSIFERDLLLELPRFCGRLQASGSYRLDMCLIVVNR